MTDMHFIKGATLAGTSGRSKDVFNPATGLVVGSVPLANASEVDAAVAAAKAALPGWANTPPAKRSQIMFKFRDLINQNLDKIAGLISGQHGKTLDDARGEVARGWKLSNLPVVFRIFLKANIQRKSQVLLTAIHCVSLSVLWLVLRRLIFRRWCQCGCSRWRWHVAIHSF